ncbi:NADPH-dependent F420 reductase [Actinomyces qiguomingii]|uniref:NADPH-dependent F420 reductase n=1 Tax=Actinomyces qiguomingii TaxID=2057800 RepID=UPI000CA045CF|nr:NAD(P)-binding domain-containing protein [Actinomyces qiguomingii]
MRIGIIGTGNIGASLVRALSAAGHEVAAANSRGPHTIAAELLVDGAKPVTSAQAVQDTEVVILSVPLSAIPTLAPLLAELPEDATIIDTSNYYPQRDGDDLLPAGTVESLWVSAQLGRPIAKAWNSIGSASLAMKGVPSATPGRIALPVAADRGIDKQRAMALVEDTGFDAYDAGPLETSWRQQPGTPAYGTDLTRELLPAALGAADAEHAPQRRDLVVKVFSSWLGAGVNPDADWSLAVARVICAGPAGAVEGGATQP